MRCPDCHQNNVPGSLFCEHCGADLTATPPPPTGTPVETPPPVPCPACGHPNPPDYAVCESCGQRLAAPAAPEPAPAPPPREPEPGPAPEPVRDADEPAAAPQPEEVPAPTTAEPAAEPAPADDPDLGPERRLETDAGPPSEPAAPPEPGSEGRSLGQLATGPRVGGVKLITEQGMVVGKQFLLNSDEMIVGREDPAAHYFPDIDLTGLDEGYVHRRHARLTFEGSFLFVTHLGGHNRTYVNNRPIADNLAHPLNIGDTVRFGKVVLRLAEA